MTAKVRGKGELSWHVQLILPFWVDFGVNVWWSRTKKDAGTERTEQKLKKGAVHSDTNLFRVRLTLISFS